MVAATYFGHVDVGDRHFQKLASGSADRWTSGDLEQSYIPGRSAVVNTHVNIRSYRSTSATGTAADLRGHGFQVSRLNARLVNKRGQQVKPRSRA